MLLLGVKTEIKWIQQTAKLPIFGGIFLFVLMFLPAVLISFLVQAIIPVLDGDTGFTKAMLVLLPGWNLILWLSKIRISVFFLPSWILFALIAIIKFLLLILGIDDGQ